MPVQTPSGRRPSKADILAALVNAWPEPEYAIRERAATIDDVLWILEICGVIEKPSATAPEKG